MGLKRQDVWKEHTHISVSPNLLPFAEDSAALGTLHSCSEGARSPLQHPLPSESVRAEGANTTRWTKVERLSPSERQILYYRGQSVGETRKKWLLYNFLWCGGDVILNRSLMCLNYTSKSTLELLLHISKDVVDVKQFIYTLEKNA